MSSSASSSRTSTLLTAAAVTAAGGLIAYAIYFDYKRRNDTEFRKKLRKEKKRINKQTEQSKAEEAKSLAVTDEVLKEALAKLHAEEVPANPSEREGYFMMQVQLGEQLSAQGPAYYLPAAMSFFRALRVYPAPVEFMAMLQNSLPDPIFKIFLQLVNAETAGRVRGYYDCFPPKRLNVTVEVGKDGAKKIMLAKKDFEAGEIIYTEHPTVAVLDADLEGTRTYCSYCFRRITPDISVELEDDPFGSAFCSEECKEKSRTGWQNLLFGADPVLPPELDNGLSKFMVQDRKKMQTPFAEHLKALTGNAHLLAARFVAKQVGHETAKMTRAQGWPFAGELEELADGEYAIGDHVERLRFVDGKVSEDESKLLSAVLGSALPGLDQFVTAERLAILVGKMNYNAMGVCPSGGRDNRPASNERPEDEERTRTPYGTAHQLGSGLYIFSSYIAHSCDPSARPSFPSGTTELELVATRPIKAGEEITMSYVDVLRREDETPEEARRRRRIELARGWKFKCECARCLAETSDEAEGDLGVSKDESKVEDILRHEQTLGASSSGGDAASSSALD